MSDIIRTFSYFVVAVIIDLFVFWFMQPTMIIDMLTVRIGLAWIPIFIIGCYLFAGLLMELMDDSVAGVMEHNEDMSALIINCGVLGSFMGLRLVLEQKANEIPGIIQVFESSIWALTIAIGFSLLCRSIYFIKGHDS